MLMIRLQRTGRKNDPNFRVVLTDKKNAPKSGSFLEILGFLNPKTKQKKLDGERIKYWIGKGAKVSPTVHNMLVQEKIIEDKKINVVPPPKKEEVKAEEKPKKENLVQENRAEVKTEEAPKEGIDNIEK